MTAVEDRGIGKADVAQAADLAFAAYKDKAPTGHKTAAVERLRRAVTWHVTDGRTASLKESTPGELAKIHGRLVAIADGKVTVDADPLNPTAGATFTAGDQSRTVMWSDFEDTSDA